MGSRCAYAIATLKRARPGIREKDQVPQAFNVPTASWVARQARTHWSPSISPDLCLGIGAPRTFYAEVIGELSAYRTVGDNYSILVMNREDCQKALAN